MKQRISQHWLILIGACLAMASAKAHADTLQIDPAHSNTAFRIRHFNAGYVLGLIPAATGTVNWDANNAANDSFDVTLDVDKLLTGNERRDNDLKGPDWFNVKQFPTMTFKSTSVKLSGDYYDVTGDFTLHGVTKSITVPISVAGHGKGMRGETRTGFEADFDIDRTDYGLKAYPGAVGNKVNIMVELECISQ